MTRLENLRRHIDHLLFQLDGDICRDGFVHLYRVSAFAVLLARKRGLDQDLATVCGLLHDINTYTSGYTKDHAQLSAGLARRILAEVGSFSKDEIDAVAIAISHHSVKHQVHDALDELLKDADVLEHHFYNPSLPGNPGEGQRFHQCMVELGIERDVVT